MGEGKSMDMILKGEMNNEKEGMRLRKREKRLSSSIVDLRF
jgi:hypothetical protein